MFRLSLYIVVLSAAGSLAGSREDIAELKKPSPNPAANRAAWDRLVAAGPTALLPILRAWPAAVSGELRLAAVDNVTAWVNGKKVIERSNDYRSLYRADRYRAAVSFSAGESTLLLKLTKTRPDEGQQAAATKAGRPGGLSTKWDFQARVLEAGGKGLSFTQSEGKK